MDTSSSQAHSWAPCHSPHGRGVGPGMEFSAQQSVNAREVGQRQAAKSKSWCVSSTVSWQDAGKAGGPVGSRAPKQEDSGPRAIMRRAALQSADWTWCEQEMKFIGVEAREM